MRTMLSHGMFVASGTGLAAALSFAYVIYVGRVLEPAAYGQFVTALSLLFFCRLSFTPIHAAITRLTAECSSLGALDKIRDLSRMLFQRINAVAIVVLIVTVLWGGSIAELVGLKSVGLLLSLLAVVYLTVVCSIPRGILRGLKRFGNYSMSMGLEAFLRLASGVLILSWVASPTSAFFAFLIGLVAIFFWTSLQARPTLISASSSSVKAPTLSVIILPLLLLMVTSGAVQNIDMFLVNTLLGPIAAGPYGAAFALTKICGTIATPFVALILPVVASAKAESRSVARPFYKTCAGFLLVSLVPMLAFALFPDKIVGALFGSEYLPGAPLLLGLFLVRLCSHLCHIAVLVSVTLDHHWPLVAYMAGLAVEILAVTTLHASAGQVVVVLLAVQAGALIVVGGITIRKMRMSGAKFQSSRNSGI